MMIINSYTKFIQNHKKFYLTKITINELLNNYKVDVYNADTEEGYQRPPISAHYKKFSKYILDNINTFTLPQSILVSVSNENIIENRENLKIIDDLSIVDGQHRIEGFKYIATKFPQEYEKIKEIEIPTTIMIVDNESDPKKKQEIEAFINLNSKGKKVSTNLALNILDKITESKSVRNYDDENSKEIFITTHIKEFALNVTLRTAKKLNMDKDSVWYDGIIMTPSESYKVVSINAFQKSLILLCENFMRKLFYEKDIIFDASNKDDSLTSEFHEYIKEIWKINADKWGECFILTSDNSLTKYNKKYNIQKGIGVFSLHLVAKECLEKSDKISDSILLYENIIKNSNIVYEDWTVGGKFSTYNSQQGFMKLSQAVQNKITI